ncbi:MAG: transcriptional regulator protein-like protein [Frankiales bacterium]|nr:transcriptional regulator protein-like protein [Frankiales bacterium]
MAAKKTERLLNLVICLLATRRFLTVQQIREAVPGYESDSEEAFRRMFERDKEELRELGVPLETGSNSHWDDEVGYRISGRDYMLPEITLEPDEAAALGLAARLWQSAPLAGATGSALLKLRAAGVETPEAATALDPRIGATEPSFEACFAGVRDGQVIRFDYRTSGRPGTETREVEPWGVVSWKGRWYLVGHDRLRKATRVFRLSRIVGEVQPEGEPGAVVRPDGIDLRSMVVRIATGDAGTTARVRIKAGSCWELRRAARTTDAEGDWDVVELDYGDPERFADQVTGYGADAVVLSPEEARAAVVRRLKALAGDAA